MNVPSRERVVLRGEHLPNLNDYIHGTRLKWDESRGYSSAFAHKHDEILKDIIENPGKLVEIVAGLDDICNCGVCPNKKESCQSEALKENDKSLASRYGAVVGEVYKSAVLVDLLKRAGKTSQP